MSMKYLGEEFDIHGGGRDLIFPHHENEICQSCAFSGKRFARYWVHNGFITVNQEKMSKSLKNFKTVRELMKRYPPMHLKFYLLSTHYRSPLDFSDELIRGSAEGLKKIQNALERADKILAGRSPFPSRSGKIRPPDEFLKALCDDFNTPRALACLFSFLSEWNRELASETVSPEAVAERYRVMLSMLEILGIRPEIRNVNEVSRDQWTDPGEEALAILDRPDTDPSPEEIRLLVAARGAGKLKKDFARADRIRNFLQSKGIELRDSANATTWKRAEKSN
jgi:cysteinyl-tRNA synthetase